MIVRISRLRRDSSLVRLGILHLLTLPPSMTVEETRTAAR